MGRGVRVGSRFSRPVFLVVVALAMALFFLLSTMLASNLTARESGFFFKSRPPKVTASETANDYTQIDSSHIPAHNTLDTSDTTEKTDGLRIAVVVTVLDIKPGKGGWMDGCAVFAKSVQEAAKRSKYHHDLIALVKPEAVGPAEEYLTRFGFRIVPSPIPIELEEIRNIPFRAEIEKSGCCGHAELIKFCAYKLVEYSFALLMDVDTLLLGPVDELYELNRTLLFTKDLFLMGDQYLDKPNFRDFAMIQGGFILLKPDMQVFEDIMDIIREGDFRPGTGWGGTEIGYGYGGPTFQGTLPYYFQSVKNMARSPQYYEVDNCVYNVMDELKGRHKGDPDCATSVKDIKIYHFTFCQKPWTCSGTSTARPACKFATDEWWRFSRQVEKELGKPERPRCEGSYEPIIIVPPTPALPPSTRRALQSSSKKPTSRPTPKLDIKPAKLDLTIPKPPSYPGATVAVCITVISAGNHFFDGLAVLATSVRQMAQKSKYKFALVALVLPSVIDSARELLEESGWVVRPAPVPVALEDMRNEAYRKEIVRSGCCGEKELIKFVAYRLTEYEAVILLDTDTLFLHPIDELLDLNATLVFTRDYAMSTHLFSLPNWRSASMIQGGFVVLRPSEEAFQGLCEQVKIGDFRPSTGWGGLNIGWGYGGPTFQGLMPFFWQHIMKLEGSPLLHEVPDCVYDTMREPHNRNIAKLGDCDNTPQEVKLAHFTECQKPWSCARPRGAQCKYLTDMWWNMSRITEKELGLPERRRCKGGRYAQLREPPPKTLAGKRLWHTSSGKCVVPEKRGEDIDDNTQLQLASGEACNSPQAYFAFVDKCLVHTDSGKCVHVYGGGDAKLKAPLVLFEQCNQPRLHFELDKTKNLRHVKTGYCAMGDDQDKVEVQEDCDSSLAQFELK